MTDEESYDKACDEVWGALPTLKGNPSPATSPFFRIFESWLELRNLERHLHWIR